MVAENARHDRLWPKEGAHRRAPAAAVGAGSPAARALLKTIKGAFDRRRPCSQAQEPAGTCAGAPERATSLDYAPMRMPPVLRLREILSSGAAVLQRSEPCPLGFEVLWTGHREIGSDLSRAPRAQHTLALVYDTCDTGVSHQ